MGDFVWLERLYGDWQSAAIWNTTHVDLQNGDFTETTVTVYGKWSAREYAIMFKPKGGSEVGVYTFGWNDKELVAFAETSRAGYWFRKWTTTSSGRGTNPNGKPVLTVDDEITLGQLFENQGYTDDYHVGNNALFDEDGNYFSLALYAYWSAKIYRVYYDERGGTQATEEGYEEFGWSDDGLTLPETSMPLHTFMGWWLEDGENTYLITDDMQYFTLIHDQDGDFEERVIWLHARWNPSVAGQPDSDENSVDDPPKRAPAPRKTYITQASDPGNVVNTSDTMAVLTVKTSNAAGESPLVSGALAGLSTSASAILRHATRSAAYALEALNLAYADLSTALANQDAPVLKAVIAAVTGVAEEHGISSAADVIGDLIADAVSAVFSALETLRQRMPGM